MGTRREFTPAARAAAAATREAKRLARAEGPPDDAPRVFVSRDPDDPQAFAFELRRFGGMLLYRSANRWPDVAAARDAGERVLAEAGRDAAPEA